jgi:acetyltransferase
VGRLSADPDGARAEFAVLARSDLKGHGIGHLFMNRLIAYARARNIGQLFGDVLVENEPMLALCRELGFKISTPSHGVIRATLVL